MIRKLWLPFTLLVPLGLTLYTASCGPTCPGLQPCTTSSGSAEAGSTSESTTCDQLTALQTCFTPYCNVTDNPFCVCYKLGKDLSPSPDCACVSFSPSVYCADAAAAGIDATNFDCSAATSGVASMCVGVQ